MTTDLEQALSGAEPTIEPQEVAEQPEVAQAESVEPVAAEAEPAEPAEPAPAKESDMVPHAVVGELRREIRELKGQLQRPEPVPTPDILEDQEGFVQHTQAQTAQQVTGTKLEMSRFFAEREFGKETVDAAYAYFDANPEKSAALLASPSPYHSAVEEFQKHQVAAEIGADPIAWKDAQRAAIKAELEAELVAKQAAERAGHPAPSLANVTGTGGGPKTTWAGPTPLEDIVGS